MLQLDLDGALAHQTLCSLPAGQGAQAALCRHWQPSGEPYGSALAFHRGTRVLLSARAADIISNDLSPSSQADTEAPGRFVEELHNMDGRLRIFDS